MRVKTYILTLSQNFMKGHEREGKPTYFTKLVQSGTKKHTIRHNYHHWRKVAEEVNAGNAVVSVRYWTGRPYFSPQEEIKQLTKLNVQQVMIDVHYNIVVDGHTLSPSDAMLLMLNDGLTPDDFKSWFPFGTEHEGVIIHFTDLTY